MQVVSLVWGTLVLVALLIGRIPYFSAVSWVLIPLAALGAALALLALIMERGRNRTAAIVGLIVNAVAMMIGLLRMFYDGGIL